MRKEDLRDWTRDKMKDEILRLEKENKELDRQNTDIQNSHMKLYNDTKDEIRRLREERDELEKQNEHIQNERIRLFNDFRTEARRLNEENNMLREEIQRLRERSGKIECCENCTCEDDLPFFDEEMEIDDLICELQDQHQQDCIRINDLTTTINVLSGLYENLRKNVGMD